MTTTLTELLEASAHLDYRAFMTCDAGGGWLSAAEAQLASWLREKGLDADLSTDSTTTDGTRHLRVLRRDASASTAIRAVLTESDTPSGTWTTELLAHDHRGAHDWLTLSVTNNQHRFVDVPRLAKYLMQSLPLSDGSITFSDTPRIVSADGVDELIDVLCDEERHGLVFAAGSSLTDGIDFGSFVRKVGVWTRQVYGLAQVVVLDPAATQRLHGEWGFEHAPPHWALRTFYPGVDPASRVDARRHRVLGVARLAQQSDSSIGQLLGRIARTHASGRTVPGDVFKLRRAFARLENQAVVRAIEEVPHSTTIVQPSEQTAVGHSHTTLPTDQSFAVAESYLEQVDLVKSVLGLETIDAASLQRIVDLARAPKADAATAELAAHQIESLQDRVEQLEDDVRLSRLLLEEDEFERAELYDQLHRQEAQTTWLRSRLADRGDYESAYSTSPPETLQYPESFGELLELLDTAHADRVAFTGSRDIALSVDNHDTWQLAVQTAWDVCLALADYVRARQENHCQHGIDHYLRHTPSGYLGCSPGKHAATETRATMQRFGQERVFPVPTSVDPKGYTTMSAHFKLAQIGMISPRLHYFDDVTKTGLVYIGYIGPHLTNTQTN